MVDEFHRFSGSQGKGSWSDSTDMKNFKKEAGKAFDQITELTPEKEAEEWMVKVRRYTAIEAFPINELIESHLTFVREVVKVMEGFGYNYVIILNEFDWCKSGALSDSTSVKIIDHNWPLAAIKAAKQTPEIRKIMKEYDAKH